MTKGENYVSDWIERISAIESREECQQFIDEIVNLVYEGEYEGPDLGLWWEYLTAKADKYCKDSYESGERVYEYKVEADEEIDDEELQRMIDDIAEHGYVYDCWDWTDVVDDPYTKKSIADFTAHERRDLQGAKDDLDWEERLEKRTNHYVVDRLIDSKGSTVEIPLHRSYGLYDPYEGPDICDAMGIYWHRTVVWS